MSFRGGEECKSRKVSEKKMNSDENTKSDRTVLRARVFESYNVNSRSANDTHP